jgi:hypothetical protein
MKGSAGTPLRRLVRVAAAAMALAACDRSTTNLLGPQVPHCAYDWQCEGRYGPGWYCAPDASLPVDHDHCLDRGTDAGDADDAVADAPADAGAD